MSPADEGATGARKLGDGLFLLQGVVNTGVLVSGERALLIDCCETVVPARLRRLGVGTVDTILCTQHRGPNVAGVFPYVERGARLIVPRRERRLFESVDTYWSDPTNRWHIYHHQPGPQVLGRPVAVADTVDQGDVIEWGRHAIRVLDTPGATGGSVSYMVRTAESSVCFSGDVIYGPGQVWDLYSLQKGQGEISDYHGFLGNLRLLQRSLCRLAQSDVDLLVPAHGSPLAQPRQAIELLLERLDAIWRNYSSISSLHHYFPGFLEQGLGGSGVGLVQARTVPLPDHVRRVAATSFAILSDDGAVLLVDCGNAAVVQTLRAWACADEISGVEGCWVTHYHDDHVDALGALRRAFECPIMCDSHYSEIVEHPERFFLPCISPYGVRVDRATVDGEQWSWREFELTAYHFPGQTYYGGGLLVQGRGSRVFFAGDSGSPTGIDDHCPGNRNFLGQGRGFRRCIALWRKLKPNAIVNQHQDLAFRFDDAELDLMDSVLAERERLFAQVLPWSDPDFGTDENWVRVYPYEQTVRLGEPFWLEAHFTNHGSEAVQATAAPVLAEGWECEAHSGCDSVVVPPRTSGSFDPGAGRVDSAIRMHVRTVRGKPGRHTIPVRVSWGDRLLGQFRHGIVNVST